MSDISDPVVTVVPEEGNTRPPPNGRKKQISPSKMWCFTLNNYTEEEYNNIIYVCSSKGEYIIGDEVGEEGTPHLQGYVKFHNKVRPINMFASNRIHWEKCKGSHQQNIDYCKKGGKFVTNIAMDKPIRLLTEFKEWQQNILDLIKTEPDFRSIYWYYEEKGNVGKTALAKYILCNNKKTAIILAGKSNDMFHGIAKHKEEHGIYPQIVIIDCPRSVQDFINYGAIEQIKNGLIYSGKYEGSQIIFDNPHVIVFANKLPDGSKLSLDRFKIQEIIEEL